MRLSTALSGDLRLSATGPASPDEVWARYTRPALWPTWSPHLREVDYPDAVVRPGTTGRVTGVGGVVAVFRIDAVDHAARTWSWSVRSGPVRVSFDHGVDAAGPGVRPPRRQHGLAGHPRAVAGGRSGYAPLARLALGRLVAPG